MKRRIYIKLHNRDGASISYALLFLLVATMVSMVIIGSALSAIKSVARDKKEQQANLTLNSVGKVFEEGLYDAKYTATKTDHVLTRSDGTTENVSDSVSVAVNSSTSEYDMASLYESAIRYIAEYPTAAYSSEGQSQNVTISLNVAGTDHNITAKYRMTPKSMDLLVGEGERYYDFVCDFTLTEGSDTYHISMTAVCQMEQRQISTGTVTNPAPGYTKDEITNYELTYDFSKVRLVAY